jgi:hypothetical protein
MIFWKILLAHLTTDFLLQTEFVAENKQKGKILILHCFLFFALSNLSLLPTFSGSSVLCLGVLSLFHGVLDFGKYRIQRGREKHGWIFFVGDQVLHVAGIGVVAIVLKRDSLGLVIQALEKVWSSPSFFILASFFILIIVGGSFFIGSFCRSFLDPLTLEEKPGVDRAGRTLGMLERSLVLTAVLVGKIEFIGYIFAAKSIARYPEMKLENKFAEYYLIGTLTSISLAFFGGLLLKRLLGW